MINFTYVDVEMSCFSFHVLSHTGRGVYDISEISGYLDLSQGCPKAKYILKYPEMHTKVSKDVY